MESKPQLVQTMVGVVAVVVVVVIVGMMKKWIPNSFHVVGTFSMDGTLEYRYRLDLSPNRSKQLFHRQRLTHKVDTS